MPRHNLFSSGTAGSIAHYVQDVGVEAGGVGLGASGDPSPEPDDDGDDDSADSGSAPKVPGTFGIVTVRLYAKLCHVGLLNALLEPICIPVLLEPHKLLN